MSVVIPAHNGSELLSECLASLIGVEQFAHIIVVDNGSEDPLDIPSTVKAIRNPTNRGYAGACNQGAEVGDAPFILFLNSDALIEAETLRRLVSIAESDTAAAIWQPIITTNDGKRLDSAGSAFTRTGFLWHLSLPRHPASGAMPIFSAKGACILVRRDVFVAIGRFDDSYFAYFEDSDLCWRARLAGWEVRLVPGCRVRHRGGATTAATFRPAEMDYLAFRNRLRSLLANASFPTLARVLPIHLVACLATAVAFLLRGRPASAVAIVKAMLWPISHSGIRSARRRAQALRTRPDETVLRAELVVSMTPRRAWQLLAAYLPRWKNP